MARITAMQAAVLSKAAKKLEAKNEQEKESQELRNFLREAYGDIANAAKTGKFEIQRDISQIALSVKKSASTKLQEEGFNVFCFEVKEETLCYNAGNIVMKISWKASA